MFNCHTVEGWSVYFDYNQSSSVMTKKRQMAFKVQPQEEHDEMVAVWDMHVLSESLEEFIKVYSRWHKEFKVPDKVRLYLRRKEMELKRGGDDANTVT